MISGKRGLALALVGPVLLGGAVHLAKAPGAVVEAGLVGALALLTSLTTWRVTGLAELALAGGLAASVFAPTMWAGVTPLAVGLAVGLLVVVPLPRRALQAVVGLLVAGGAGWLVGPRPLAGPIAAGLGLVGVLLRPEHPTAGQVRFLRRTSLFAPALVLFGLVIVNAVAGIGGSRTVLATLRLGVGVSGALVVLAAGGLGLTVLLESRSEAQARVWTASAVGVAVAAGTLPARDPSLTLVALSAATVPAGVLVALALGRQLRDGPGTRTQGWLSLFVVLATQAVL